MQLFNKLDTRIERLSDCAKAKGSWGGNEQVQWNGNGNGNEQVQQKRQCNKY
jgi:hypothetical protein